MKQSTPPEGTRTTEPTLKKGDATSLWLFLGLGFCFAAFTTYNCVVRIIELLRNDHVAVPAVFDGTVATAPIGKNGAPVQITLDRATLDAPSLPLASTHAGILEAVIIAGATITIVVLLTILSRRLISGHIFSKRNTRLVAATGIIWVAGLALTPWFGNMVANGAFARISDRTFNNIIMSSDFSTIITGLFLAAFVASVFAIGDRFRRETEGLV